MVLLSEVTHPEDAAFTADKILAAVNKPHRIGHQDLHVTVSVGIAVYPSDGADAETLLSNADLALLHAKAHGRGNHQFFEPNISVRSVERRSEPPATSPTITATAEHDIGGNAKVGSGHAMCIP